MQNKNYTLHQIQKNERKNKSEKLLKKKIKINKN